MTTILMPIKPKYVDEILNGNKKYEYRKIKPKMFISKMLIYSTSPVMKIVAEVEIIDIISDTPIELWNKTKNLSGIEYKSYIKYFNNKEIAYAYKLGNIKIYNKPKLLKDIGINYIPQSYIYLD